jgi:hypothetical protein
MCHSAAAAPSQRNKQRSTHRKVLQRRYPLYWKRQPLNRGGIPPKRRGEEEQHGEGKHKQQSGAVGRVDLVGYLLRGWSDLGGGWVCERCNRGRRRVWRRSIWVGDGHGVLRDLCLGKQEWERKHHVGSCEYCGGSINGGGPGRSDGTDLGGGRQVAGGVDGQVIMQSAE